MGLSGKQPGLLVAVIVPALLSTFVVIARSMSKVKRRPSYISKTGALVAEVLLIASVVRFPFIAYDHECKLTECLDLRLDLWHLCRHLHTLWVWYTPSRHLGEAQWHERSHQCRLLADHGIP